MRKFLSLFLAAILVLSSLCLPAVAQETETLSGSGTEDSPYLIKTAADFATAKKMIAADYEERVVVKYEEDGETPKSVSVTRYCANGVYFKLAPEEGNTITIPAASAGSPLLCDLVTDAYDEENPYVLEDTEITTATVNQFFVGHLDGNNVTVTFEGTVAPASVTPGGIFFCYIGGPDYDSDADEIVDKTFTASVKNLTISSLTVAYSNSASGQFAVLTGSVNGTASIDNVDVLNVTFTDSSASNTHNRAAIVGKHNGGNCTVENCDVTGSFTGTGTTVNLGAIVGSAGASKDLLIKNCTANVNLTAGAGCAGGIVAQFAGSGITTVQNCTVNTAQGAGENKIKAAGGTVGGIVGNPAGAGTLNILNCVVDGVVTATNYAGGATGSVTKANETVTVEGFTNKADVKAKHAGAVFARANQIVTLTAKNIINEGTIAGGNDGGTASAVVGTITVAATLNVTNLYNKGTLEGYQKSTNASATGANIGLVIGDSKAKVNASYVINSGTIGSDYVLRKGVFAGRLQSGAHSLTNCYNFATTGLANVDTVGASATMTASDVHAYTELGIAYAGPKTHNDFFRVLDGARIRLDVDEAAENGLRFDIAVDANLVQALKDAGYTVQLKSLMAYADNVTAATFNKATLDAASLRYSDSTQDVVIKANGTYSAALINFAVEQYSKNIACVGYIEATKGGETIYFYTAYDAANARSVAQVANAALEDETVDYSAYTEILNTFAGK